MNEIDAKFPPTIFYTKQKDSNVKNDFYFTIETNCSIRKDIPSEQKTPKIYIKGLEQLFSSESAMEAFAKSFQASSNVDDWIITYGCFRDTQELCLVATYCLDPEASSIPENIFPIAFRSVQEKFQFTADFSKFSDKDPIGIQVYFDDFDFLSSELKDKIGPQKYSINVNEIAYILDFYAKYTKDAKDPQAPKVQAIHKGEEAEIGWDLGDVHKVSASLCDENGCQVANLPFTYNVKIDRDRKFTLSVEKDGHVETKSLPVYRTLWEKVAEGKCPDGFTPDPKGNNKFFKSLYDNNYYTYIHHKNSHPKIFYSEDLISWKEITIQIDDTPPNNFNYYHCNYYYENAITLDSLIICYTCDDCIYVYKYIFETRKLININIQKNYGYKSCQVIVNNKNIDFFYQDDDSVINSNQSQSGIFYSGPIDSKIIAFDTLFDDKKLLAILCDNNRVYVYDTEKRCIDNIFEFESNDQKKISLIKTNSFYILLDDYTFELNDKEKFTDIHFFPKDINKNPLIIGERDNFTFSAIIQEKDKINIWNYNF